MIGQGSHRSRFRLLGSQSIDALIRFFKDDVDMTGASGIAEQA